ncbi:MAG: hypothetical protein FJ096_06945 [Deltaproteobacteria bacterium]|nr:hypothetical protein [Deltaproteobacteria bacterium]
MSRSLRAILAGLVFCGALEADPGRASGADRPATLAEAEAAEARAEPAQALELYRQFAAAHQGERLARRADARIAWLDARREGGFAPLRALLAMRARASDQPSAAELRAFAVEVARFPEGRVRRESYELLGDTWLARLDAPAEALECYVAWSREPGIDEAERQLAESGAALARARLGQTGEALQRLERSGLRQRSEGRFLRAERIRRLAVAASLVAIAAHALILVNSLIAHRRQLAWRTSVGRVEVGLATFTLGLPILFVERFDSQLVHAFAPAMVAMAAALLVTWIAACFLAPAPRERRRLALGSAASVIAAGLLACAHSGMLTELLMAAWEPR